MRKNLIFGGLGQDGRLLSQNLISKNESVLSVVNTTTTSRQLHGVNYVSVTNPDIGSYCKILTDFGPDVIYNFASLSSVAASQESPEKSFQINYGLVLMIMSAIQDYLRKSPGKNLKLVHAGSSEMFGELESPVNESSPMRPRTLYGEHKKHAFDYLESQKGEFRNLEISNLLLFNHESIFRPEYFVSQKIAAAAASWKTRNIVDIRFGNIDIERDWGCAREYVEAIRLVGSQLSSENYVIASGQLVRVRDILEHAMTYVGNANCDLNNYLDLGLFRQVETAPLVGDTTKIRKSLGWKAKRSVYSVIEEMIDNQIRKLGE